MSGIPPSSSEPNEKGKAFGFVTIMLFCIWFAVVFTLGSKGFFRSPSPFFLSWLQTAIVTPMAVFWIMFGLFKGFRSYIAQLDLLFLTAVQCLRVLGLAVLIMWGYGLLPGGFAIPMSVLDASVGVIAVYVVWMMHHKKPGWKATAVVLHSWGFLDFIVTVTLALFAWRSLAIDPAVNADGYASLVKPPLSLFPSFAIPFFSCLHFAAWIKLAQLPKTQS